MKGIILAGGKATRLRPLTKITSKQLLPVYDKPMIFYPIETLLKAGIKQILIIVAPEYAGHYLKLLGSGRDWNAKFTYEIQDEARGIADAFIIGESFIGNNNVALILGDNIFDYDFSEEIKSFKSGGKIAVTEVEYPQRYGVVEFDDNNKVISIEEKPENPKSNFASVGLYLYDSRVCEIAKSLTPSERNELEITSYKKSPAINNTYFDMGELEVMPFGGFYEDAGTFDSLLRANNYMAEKAKHSLS
jgi:glucose-1-phosphate thymidylyltransferase